MTFDSVVDVKNLQECKLTPDVSDIYLKPHLAYQKTIWGGGVNKKKIGSLDGMNECVRNGNKVNEAIKSCITAAVCEQVSTADLYPILDGNCDHNTLQFSECGDNHVTMDSQKVFTNYINKKVHTFGFCPLTTVSICGRADRSRNRKRELGTLRLLISITLVNTYEI